MLYPLRFQPIFRQYLWGGRRLATVLGKSLGTGEDYAESWEVVDHGADQSVVQWGPLAGRTLGQIALQWGAFLYGQQPVLTPFPLLFKFLDAHQNLSVQVHPNDDQARELNPPDRGKTEAWVVMHAEPGSVIYAGLKRGFDREAFVRELSRGTAELCLHRIEPQVGDCIFIPAGTIHAIGTGLLIAEIQQSSDTTFRLFDWNRVDAQGRPRPLHLEQGLAVANFEQGPVPLQRPLATAQPERQRLIACPQFVLDRWTIDQPTLISGDARFHLLAVLEGSVHVDGDPSTQPLAAGESLLLPACCGSTLIRPLTPTQMLDIYLP